MKIKRWHVHVSAATVAVAVAWFAFAALTAADYATKNGVRLSPRAQKILVVVAKSGELGSEISGEQLPPSVIAKLRKANQAAALAGTAGPSHPVTLASPEPVTKTALVRNYSSRHGYRPALLVVHDTESPNAPGLADVDAIESWFNNPSSQASSNYTTDADGNTILLVPETAKAWTQAYFNPWAISDELIGYASQRSWPDVQLRATAKIFAAAAARWGIPVQRGAVSGCRIVRPGIVEHADLGGCGGGHHDAGANFPLTKFVALVKQYRAGGYRPAKEPSRAVLRARARKAVLELRRHGQSWQAIKSSASYRRYVAYGGR